jgi:hypothetical protein
MQVNLVNLRVGRPKGVGIGFITNLLRFWKRELMSEK